MKAWLRSRAKWQLLLTETYDVGMQSICRRNAERCEAIAKLLGWQP